MQGASLDKTLGGAGEFAVSHIVLPAIGVLPFRIERIEWREQTVDGWGRWGGIQPKETAEDPPVGTVLLHGNDILQVVRLLAGQSWGNPRIVGTNVLDYTAALRTRSVADTNIIHANFPERLYYTGNVNG